MTTMWSCNVKAVWYAFKDKDFVLKLSFRRAGTYLLHSINPVYYKFKS